MGATSPDGGLISTYEGAAYCQFGAYRPSENSIMRTLEREFNSPSREAMVVAFYAKASVATGVRVSRTVFRVDIPVVGPHGVTWFVDGQRITGANGERRFQLPRKLQTGRHTVKVVVADTTAWVLDPVLKQQLVWNRSWAVTESG